MLLQARLEMKAANAIDLITALDPDCLARQMDLGLASGEEVCFICLGEVCVMTSGRAAAAPYKDCSGDCASDCGKFRRGKNLGDRSPGLVRECFLQPAPFLMGVLPSIPQMPVPQMPNPTVS